MNHTSTTSEGTESLIFEYTGHGAEGWQRATLNADKTITLETASGTSHMTPAQAATLGTLRQWAHNLHLAQNGQLPGYTIGQVGQRLAAMHVEHTLGRQRARALHVQLARLGYTDHNALASRALGHAVTSFRTLTHDEAQTILQLA